MNQAVEMVNEVEVKESRKSTFMQRVWAKMGKEEKGFTLIELLAVLIIIAIIAVIAIPLIGGIINNSKKDSDEATARQLYDAARLYIVGEKNGTFEDQEVTLAQLVTGKYIDSTLVLPSNKEALDAGTQVNFGDDGQLTNVTIPNSESSDGDNGVFSANQVLQTPTTP